MATEIRTEHPHIVRVPGVSGGRPTIEGTRISVDFIVRFLRDGVTPDEIVSSYPHLTHATVYDAIAFYYDHQAEIDEMIRETTLEKLAEKYNFEIREDGRVVFNDL